MTYLLDVNLLVALAWPSHVHHRAAHTWWARAARGRGRWASCAVTQLGFTRVSSNPAFSPDALSPSDAVALLEASTSSTSHVYLSQQPEVAALPAPLRRALRGHHQVADAYLMAVCAAHKTKLATFDAGIEALAEAGGCANLVERVSSD